MRRTQQLFLLAAVLMPLHVLEQLLFGIDELYELQAMVGACLSWFDDRERGTVVLVGLVVTIVLLFCYGLMAGGVARLVPVTFFGLEFMFEGHHIVKTVVRGSYFPGAVTAAALVALGAFVLMHGWRDYSARRAEADDPALTFAGA